MFPISLRSADVLRKLNSATKYPDIPTFHTLEKRPNGKGRLIDQRIPFSGPVLLTEKVDGTNARLILLPDGTWVIGGANDLLTARGDLIPNPSLGIVDALSQAADGVDFGWVSSIVPGGGTRTGNIVTFHVEVYGNRQLPAWREYGDGSTPGCRLFDVSVVPHNILDGDLEKIAGWRDRGGQTFLHMNELSFVSEAAGLQCVPFLQLIEADKLPVTVDEMSEFLKETVAETRVALGEPGRAEGVVLRNPRRTAIAKARFVDYERTLHLRALDASEEARTAHRSRAANAATTPA